MNCAAPTRSRCVWLSPAWGPRFSPWGWWASSCHCCRRLHHWLLIHAEGELQASEKPLAAAEILSRNPQAMQLRYLQTLAGIAGDKTNTIVFPVPGEFMDLLTRGKAPREGA